MSKDIKIRKGLDIKLEGEAQKVISATQSSTVYSIRPEDFHGIVPKALVKVGASVKIGSPLFHSKTNASLLFVSPASGVVKEIVRGEKRKILAFNIEADQNQIAVDHSEKSVDKLSSDQLKEHLLVSGCWPFIKQRPYDVIANPESKPKSVFISAYNTLPLGVDFNYILEGKEKELQVALNAIAKITDAPIHVSVGKAQDSVFSGLSNISLHQVSGPHPAGNVSTQIANIDPINKGEVVWTIAPQDLIVIGELLLTGKFNPTRKIAVAGSSVKKPQYYTTKIGTSVNILLQDATLKDTNSRVISGNVLTGRKVDPIKGKLGYYHDMITVIPEGDDYEFFGWNKPVFNKISPSRALTFSWLFPNKKYNLNTNTNGEHRAFVLTGNYESVCPLDIYPLQLLKACLVEDLDQMEQLGIYEVAPEDFALTEFVCVSKQPHQKIIRDGLDVMIKEIG